jgi:hypothetical protein
MLHHPNHNGGINMYRLEVQLTPQIHEGSMAYYWHIYLLDGGNKITVKHGWEEDVNDALESAYDDYFNMNI